jgi:hypothetical protein
LSLLLPPLLHEIKFAANGAVRTLRSAKSDNDFRRLADIHSAGVPKYHAFATICSSLCRIPPVFWRPGEKSHGFSPSP